MENGFKILRRLEKSASSAADQAIERREDADEIRNTNQYAADLIGIHLVICHMLHVCRVVAEGKKISAKDKQIAARMVDQYGRSIP